MTKPEDITIERDLSAIEDGLHSGEALHEDPLARELQELALELRADATAPRATFAAELGERVDAGFPPPAGSRRARLASARGRVLAEAARIPRSPRKLLPAAGVATAALVAAVAITSLPGVKTSDGDGGSGGRDESRPEPLSGGPPASGGPEDGVSSHPLADDDAASAQPLPADEARSGAYRGPGDTLSRARIAPDRAGGGAGAFLRDGGFAPGQAERRIERSIALELAAPVDEMAELAERVTAATNRYGGFVLSSSVTSGDADATGGDFDLRIPAGRLRPALRDLSALATVRSQSQTGRDVTREQVTAADRLRAARAERRSLLRRLEEADTDEEAEAIRRRLDMVSLEIRGLRSQLRDLRLRTDYAAVVVTLVAKEGGSDVGAGSFDDALDDAGRLLVGTAGVLIRVLALALPLALLALAGWLAASLFRRRRRESALA